MKPALGYSTSKATSKTVAIAHPVVGIQAEKGDCQGKAPSELEGTPKVDELSLDDLPHETPSSRDDLVEATSVRSASNQPRVEDNAVGEEAEEEGKEEDAPPPVQAPVPVQEEDVPPPLEEAPVQLPVQVPAPASQLALGVPHHTAEELEVAEILISFADEVLLEAVLQEEFEEVASGIEAADILLQLRGAQGDAWDHQRQGIPPCLASRGRDLKTSLFCEILSFDSCCCFKHSLFIQPTLLYVECIH